MTDSWLSATRAPYDTDAFGYAEKVRGLLDASLYLRASLALFADLVRDAGGGLVANLGCGPGYVTRHLHDLGVDAFGIDLSPEMIAIARRDYPDLRFEVGTMTDLDLADDSALAFSRSGPRSTCRITLCPGCSHSSIACCAQDVPCSLAFMYVTRHAIPVRATRVARSTSKPPQPARRGCPLAAGGRVHHRRLTGDTTGRGCPGAIIIARSRT